MRRVLLVAVLVISVTAVNASGRTWLIRPDGTGDAPSIKAAVYYGADGDTLLLADGVFTGRDNTEVSYRGKALVIRSQSGNPHACVIDCNGSDLNWSRGFLFYYGEDKSSVLEGVTVRNGYGYEGGGIWCWSSSPTVRDVILAGNTAVFSGGGVYCGGGSSPDLVNVTIYDNTAVDGGGICCVSQSSPLVHSTIIAYNRDGGSVYVADIGCTPSFACCDIYGNTGGDWITSIEGWYRTEGNVSVDPLFCLEENPPEPLTLHNTSPCIGGHLACGRIGAAGVGCRLGAGVVIDIEPDVLNTRSNGRWITCYIEPAGDLDPEEIDVASVILNDSIPAESHPTSTGDYDDDGVADLMVKFDRADVLSVLDDCGDVEIRVGGEGGGSSFAGTDTIYVLCKGVKGKPQRARAVLGESPVDLVAESVPGGRARIRFRVPGPGEVTLSVYSVEGRLVRKLVDGAVYTDTHDMDWDGLDNEGFRVAGGVYFLRLETEKEVVTGKTIIIR